VGFNEIHYISVVKVFYHKSPQGVHCDHNYSLEQNSNINVNGAMIINTIYSLIQEQ